MCPDLPPIGAWVRVHTNTTPGSPTFLGLVVQHRAQPDRALVLNMRGGVVAGPAEVFAVLDAGQVARLAGCTVDQVQAVYANLLGERTTGEVI